MERYPKLKFVSVENEIGWMPFMLQQWDYYYNRFKKVNPPPINKNPSEYFNRQVYGTFFRDTAAGRNFEWWGQDNCMWSNDYPHGNSTWPESKKYIDRDLGHLPGAIRKKLVCTNVAKLYGMEIPQPLQAASQAAAAVH
jgi:predicted TIM-barrel fold metal-dependent hydrolase